MQHNDHDKKDRWHKDGYKYVKERQIEILKQQVPSFNENNWVLWIVPDLYYEYTAKIHGDIVIEKKNGSILVVPFLQRTPYPNKRIYQLSMKKGNRRFLGFPLVFNSFEELAEVKKISIKWDIYQPLYLKEDCALEANAINIIVNYNLDFKKDDLNPEHRFFTVHSKDYTYDSISTMRTDADLCKKYYEEFDKALNTRGIIEYTLDSNEYVAIALDVYDLKFPDDSSELTPQEKEILSSLENHNQEIDLLKDTLSMVKIKDEVQWETFYYERTETLTASYMADLLP